MTAALLDPAAVRCVLRVRGVKADDLQDALVVLE